MEQGGSPGPGGLTGEDFRRLAELAPDAMLAHRHGVIAWVNRAAAELVRAPLESLTGRSLFDFVRPEDRAALRADIERSVAEARAATYRHKLVRATGEVVEAEFQRWPIGGDVMLVVVRDLSGEQQRRSAEARARAFFETTSEAVGISKNGIQVEANQACATLMGYDDPAQMVGLPIMDMLDPSEHQRVLDYVARRAAGDTAPLSYVALARRRDGSTFLADLKASAFQDGDEWLSVVVVRDITAQRAEEERRRHAEKLEAIGRLAGGVAHDFNNILATIMAHCELARRALPHGSPAEEDLRTIGEAAVHARDLVRQILTFGRRERPQRVPTDPGKAVAEALTLARAAIPSAVTVDVRLAPPPGSVIVDPTELQQVVLNLCSNARDAIVGNGHIELVLDDGGADAPAELAGRCVRLRVRDDGVGMDAETKARLFEPYHTTRGDRGGHGLGLAVVHGIVTSLGGAVHVDSAPGRGATFDVYLPRSTEPVLEARPVPAPVGGLEHLLLVDDEPLVRTATRRLLESIGYRVTMAVDGADALARVRAAPGAYALVLSDVIMPRLSGVELARVLKDEHPSVPVVLISGYSDGLQLTEAAALGVHHVLAKPVSRDELAAAVRSALDA